MPSRIPYHGSRSSPIRDVALPDPDKVERDKFYSRARWRKLRALQLSRQPLCASCAGMGLVTAATMVHHVKPRLEYPALAYTLSNLESICSPCHTRLHKSAEVWKKQSIRDAALEIPTMRPAHAPTTSPILALDFNGVIHDHVRAPNGKGPIRPDAPAVPGAIAFLKRSVATFSVAILSARFARPGSAGLESMVEARAWLIEHGVPSKWITFDPDRSGKIFLSGSKVPYLVSLDDRSIRFDGTFPDPASLLVYRPWNVAG